MKFNNCILSLLILSMLFVSNVQAFYDAGEVSVGQGESLAETLLQSSGRSNPADERFAQTPQESRELQKNKSSLDWIMPSTLGTGTISPKSSRATVENNEVSQDEETSQEIPLAANTSSTVQTELPPEPSVASIGGSWSFELNDDSSKRDVALAIFQSGNYVYGAGNMREGNSTLQVAASGSVQGQTMNLDIISLGTINLYKLALDLSGDSALGAYQAFSASGDAWKGSAEGLKLTA